MTESDLLFDLKDRVAELERENAALLARIERHERLLRKLGDLAKLDLQLAELEMSATNSQEL